MHNRPPAQSSHNQVRHVELCRICHVCCDRASYSPPIRRTGTPLHCEYNHEHCTTCSMHNKARDNNCNKSVRDEV